MGITKKGPMWELKNSYWILFCFTFLFYGLGLYIAGRKARVNKWKKHGIIHLITFWVSMFIIGSLPTKITDGIVGDIFVIIVLISMGLCIFESFKIRKEYLIRLEIIGDRKIEEKEVNDLRDKIQKEYNENENKNFASFSVKEKDINNK
ncbi:hypothetical protein [Clostridium cylindrosporum]|uniref:Uncharacterized protein n=1 Tax=Clostridium cylindrosporum DSM 605 TaxID=1121307 RepID=A0A0J8FZS2_CLOCY|nr:hypothetical protein [Clostridium cylindrosporum]KMT21061.1 hypothetical protein CLCY_1c02950 [Clostridium cylindrosporum DSM 605]